MNQRDQRLHRTAKILIDQGIGGIDEAKKLMGRKAVVAMLAVLLRLQVARGMFPEDKDTTERVHRILVEKGLADW